MQGDVALLGGHRESRNSAAACARSVARRDER
jgi:hypothetical protein